MFSNESRRMERSAPAGRHKGRGQAAIPSMKLLPHRLWRKWLTVSALLVPAVGLGQLSTDAVPRQRTVPTRTEVKEEVENRRFRLGPFRLIPIFRLSNAGYDSNVFGRPKGQEIGDYTATATAGVRWFVPVGTKIYVTGQALPGYTWYKDLTDQRTFQGVYQTSFLGFFNRASLEIGGFNSKGLSYVSSETETRVVQTTLDGSARLEVDVASNLSLFGGAEVARLRYGLVGSRANSSGIDINQFQRAEGAARGGVRYRISPAWDVSAAYEKTQTRFVDVPSLRDNQSDGYVLGLHYDRPRFFMNLSGGYRQGKPYNGSSFAPYSTATGSYFASYFLTRRVELKAYGLRRVSYGLIASQFLESRYGGGINVQVHPKILLQGFGESGTNDFSAATSAGISTPGRVDKVNNYGGGFSWNAYRKMVLTATVTESNYKSTAPGLDRSVVRFTTGISFDGQFSR